MDESFPAKRLKSNKMINDRATSGSEATLHINEQIVGFKVPDKSTVDHLFHGFTDATCQRNRTIIRTIRGIYQPYIRWINHCPSIHMKIINMDIYLPKYLW